MCETPRWKLIASPLAGRSTSPISSNSTIFICSSGAAEGIGTLMPLMMPKTWVLLPFSLISEPIWRCGASPAAAWLDVNMPITREPFRDTTRPSASPLTATSGTVTASGASTATSDIFTAKSDMGAILAGHNY